MAILVAGANYKTAPLEVRERLSLAGDKLEETLHHLPQYVNSGVILSTCNRTEIYTTSEMAASEQSRLYRFLSDISGLPSFLITSYLYTYRHKEAAKHLFQVASGLDSMVVGETQILGQVREALEMAQKASTASLPLTKLFHHALRVGRRARHDTDISRNAASVSSAAVALAKNFWGDLDSAAILVIGAGRMGARTAKILASNADPNITVTNRTHTRAIELANEVKGEACPFDQLEQALARSDIVFSATTSLNYILTAPLLKKAMRQRNQRDLYIVDIAVPRDVDPEVKKIKNVFLRDIDDLKAVSESSLRGRQEEVSRVEAIIDSELDKFGLWWNALEARPTIIALRHKAEAIRQREIDKTIRKLPNLSPEERRRIDSLTTAIINKLLHHSLMHLKQNGHYKDLEPEVRELFDLP
ncbi:MAG: glutamyl-tRNA reductase [Chloroflexi bacterium]|nr:glutamyl-tRNA reductase [Chloroflexota bacterium]